MTRFVGSTSAINKKTEEVFTKLANARVFTQLNSLRPILETIERFVAAGQNTMPATCTVHGDLCSRHVIISHDHEFAGVIDWVNVHCGHPAVDLAFVHTFLPPDAVPHFYAAYGEVPLLWQQVAKFRELYHDVVVAVWLTGY